MQFMMYRSLQKSNRNINESLVRKALHLLGHGLNEEIARNKREAGHYFQFTHNAARWNIFEILDKMLQDSALNHHHKMILWLRNQHSAIKPDTFETQAPLVAQPDEEVKNYTTIGNRIKTLSCLELIICVVILQEEKKRKAELIKEAKEKMMAKMAAAQKKFMLVNKDLFSEGG